VTSFPELDNLHAASGQRPVILPPTIKKTSKITVKASNFDNGI
jgi:hypothetical protein